MNCAATPPAEFPSLGSRIDRRLDLFEARMDARLAVFETRIIEGLHQQRRTLVRALLVSNSALALAVAALAFGAGRLA